ncbi:DUF4238 domain-containing protein [Rhodococcus sp. IEGM 1366]|uniref:DUF4238 domain-containing protein n=1 Tax=Rhodococcus sp. IEGM 1366 TaxID=3082223 RepID=UPI002954CAD4|nr:DUF4238 domain-containing protein [Rhodococcus sp. IEGM 1366]MDV8065739.1 DUF4238 domain-containing protein [Rhodococcus sp. IEGM 1366]
MSNIIRNHHTVPRFYLNRFADTQKQIGVVELPGAIRVTRSTKSTTVARNFYNVEGLDAPEDFFEREFGKIEDTTAKVFAKVLDKNVWPLEPDGRRAIAVFAALQHLRGPSQRNHLGQLNTAMTRLEIATAGRENIRQFANDRFGFVDLRDDEVERIWQYAVKPDAVPSKVPALAHMSQLADYLPKSVKYFQGRPWTLIRFARKSIFTCDTPVSLIPDPHRESYEGVGLMTAWGITLPLSRHVGLLMASTDPVIDANISFDRVAAGEFDIQQPPSASFARMFNDASVRNARRHILHHPDDAAIVPRQLPEPTGVEVDTSGVEDLIDAVQQMDFTQTNLPDPIDQETGFSQL